MTSVQSSPVVSAIALFPQWLERVQAGEPAAAAEFVSLFEPRLLVAIRGRLAHFRLARVIDARDICQTVFSRFFGRAASGGFTIGSAEQLDAFLMRMARNRVHDEARRYLAHRRDFRRLTLALPSDPFEHLAAAEPTPSKVAAGHELLAEIRRRFTDEECRLLDERAAGRDWAAIADRHGGQPEALRKKLNRAVHRVLRELQVEV
jgi:DNA-directed RNA polymerase specialized sigma24 family protein